MTSPNRRPLSAKTRFEIFKRDGFVCMYCGAHPPAVTLHVDHITPVADGGMNDPGNLVTACQACNLGKGARSLSDVPQALAEKAEQTEERERQLRGYHEVMAAKARRLDAQVMAVADRLDPACSYMNERGMLSIRRFIDSIGLESVDEAIRIAAAKFPWMNRYTFRYFCGVCLRMKREIDGDEPKAGWQ